MLGGDLHASHASHRSQARSVGRRFVCDAVRVAAALVVTSSKAHTGHSRQPATIGKNGQTLRGTATGRMNGDGSFSVTDGQLACSGNYNSLSAEITINAQVLCSDGRKGIVISTRESSGVAGHGTVKLNDGSEWTFIFGSAAANF
jgi:hypothetical protein